MWGTPTLKSLQGVRRLLEEETTIRGVKVISYYPSFGDTAFPLTNVDYSKVYEYRSLITGEILIFNARIAVICKIESELALLEEQQQARNKELKDFYEKPE